MLSPSSSRLPCTADELAHEAESSGALALLEEAIHVEGELAYGYFTSTPKDGVYRYG